jgi:hypothetical protein
MFKSKNYSNLKKVQNPKTKKYQNSLENRTNQTSEENSKKH